jgi:hypothetical protein
MTNDAVCGSAEHGTRWEARLRTTMRRRDDGASPTSETHWAVTAGEGVVMRIELERLPSDAPRERVIEVVNERLRSIRPGL